MKTSLAESRITYQPSISPLKEHENCMIYPLMMYRFQHFRQDRSIISVKATRHVLLLVGRRNPLQMDDLRGSQLHLTIEPVVTKLRQFHAERRASLGHLIKS
jgi:hypothetical protein